MAGQLLTELKQTRPFRSREDEAYLNLIRTAELLKREIGELMRPHELSPAQYNVLRILRGAQREKEPHERARTYGDIAARLVTFEPDVTRLLDKLTTMKLIERERDEQDRRVVRSRITSKGLAILEALDAPLIQAQKKRFSRLDQEKLLLLINLLEEIRV